MARWLNTNTENNISLDIVKTPIVITGYNEKIIYTNQAFLDLISSTRNSVTGKDVKDVILVKQLRNALNSVKTYGKTLSERIIFRENHFEVNISPLKEEGANHIVMVFYDISEFVRLEEKLTKKNQDLMIINTLSSVLVSAEETDISFSNLLDKIFLITEFRCGWIALEENGIYLLKAYKGVPINLQRSLEKGEGDFLYTDVINRNEPLLILESEDISKITFLKKEGLIFVSMVPVRIKDRIRGVICLIDRMQRQFDFDLAYILYLVGNQASLVIERISLIDETKKLAITDSLTGLYNVRFFYTTLDYEIARTDRYGTPFSLIIYDIDDFKFYNDTYGHQAGDDVLQSVSGILKKECRNADVVTRYGGEEFVVILPNTPKLEAFVIAERVREKVEHHIFEDNIDPDKKITLSGGIATYPEDAHDAKSLLYVADKALYKAKALGKKRIYCYRKGDEENIQKTGKS